MINNYNNILNIFLSNKNLYLKRIEKKSLFLKSLLELNNHHFKFCEPFKNILKFNNFKIELKKKVEDEIFLPVNLFKKFDLISIKKKNIINKLNSSGTSGTVSKIYLDSESALINNRVLFQILRNNFKNFDIPIIFIDKEPILNKNFDARKAAIKGFSILSKKKYYVMNEDGSLNVKKLNNILQTYNKAYIFGFTSIVWSLFNQNKKLIKNNLKDYILIHGGGWKKLQKQNIDTDTFNNFFLKNFKIKKIKNYYGMVEQIGSIFFTCKFNFFHTHSLSDVVIRDKKLQSISFGKSGIVQLLSLLPRSYPGHSILTEDIGTVFGEDDCKCGRAGKYFKIWGRLPKSEIRGCSDV